MKSIISSLLILFFLASCEEVIDLDLNYAGPKLVIEGLITDEEGPYTFSLTETTPYDFRYNQVNLQYVEGATIIVSDNTGTIDTLNETSHGIYQTHAEKLQGTVGRTYVMDIFMQDGRHYMSYPETMVASPEIDSIYYERDRNDMLEGTSAYRFSIYIDWQDPADEQNFYLRQMNYFWNGSWQNHVNWFWVLNDKYFNGVYMKKKLINSSYGESNFLVQVKQFSLNKRAYQYWELVHEQINRSDYAIINNGVTLYSNVYNVDNPEDVILGYFQVSSVQVAEISL